MEPQTFKITINASPEKVWSVLLGQDTYPLWTSVFSENSTVKTDWKEGSKALFLDGNDLGMVSVIVKNIPNEFLSIKHLGFYKNGVEDLDSEEIKEWSGALENYSLSTVNGGTELRIDLDVADKWKNHFLVTWPEALNKVKELAEK